MPFCPHCRSEYRPGFDACADCGAPLVERLESMDHTRSVHEVAVGHYSSQFEAEMWAEYLRSHGVPSVLAPLVEGSAAYGFSLGTSHELRVRAEDARRARELLGQPG